MNTPPVPGAAAVACMPYTHADGTPLPGVWRVTLQHPGRLNAMTRAMWRRLREVFVQLHADRAVRCIVLQGADGHFCAGGDISEYPGFRFDAVQLQHFHEVEVWGALQAILDCDAPVVAAIDGACMGAGVELAACCDIRWVDARAQFGAPIAKLGFPMAPQEVRLVTRTLGGQLAQRMLLEAAVFPAQDLVACGFAAWPDGSLDVHSMARHSAERIARLAPSAARLNKQTLRSWREQGGPPPQPYAYADSAEHREGIAAFLAKRRPDFGGQSA